ncbi:hypothetical protein M595_2711 [Lyngbya aestuarii BL J]|uniref:Uncharacterized protein n=1 Tax=Lyngbya aestuarii BL J TaxID=1348334 RepID=U7QJ42_9CYAN|nr:hypothetical protein [Lyngbya aestuarii]ERT07312.1 hypothetical protein M595_2711 [Lyngbya aestuarii BL J]
MFTSKLNRSGTSLLIALGLTVSVATPVIFNPNPAVAQRFPGSLRRDGITAGTLIPIEYETAEKIVLTPEETVPVTLKVSKEVRTTYGQVWLPQGSEINGELRPASGGSQFIADEVILGNGRRYRLNANSQVVTRTETIRKGASAGDILKGAAIGAAAATAIAGIVGDKAIATEEVLGGAGLGAIAGVFLGREKVEVLVIRPEEDLDLRLQSDLVFR